MCFGVRSVSSAEAQQGARESPEVLVDAMLALLDWLVDFGTRAVELIGLSKLRKYSAQGLVCTILGLN